MPKKTKDVAKESGNVTEPAISDLAEKSGGSKPKPAKRKKVAKRAPRVASAAVRELSSPGVESAPAQPEPSLDEIRVRAYFLSERRIELSQPADASADWLEAKRQLLEEAGATDT